MRGYLPCRLGRISTLATSKSGACLTTISVMFWAKPRSFLPMILIGKSQGKANADSGRNRLSLARAHDLLLELLIELVHAPEYRARLALANRLAIERHDREHFLGGRGHPHFVRAAHLGFADVPELHRQPVGGGELADHVVRDAGQDQIALRR